MKKLSILELAQYLSVTKRTVQRRAIKEGWRYEEQYCLGGTRRLYPFVTLPNNIKSKLVAAIVARHETLAQSSSQRQKTNTTVCDANETISAPSDEAALLAEQEPAHWLAQYCASHSAGYSEFNKDDLKFGLLALAKAYVEQHGFGKIQGFDHFCQQYNDRLLPLDQEIYLQCNHISRITLLRWEKKQQQLTASLVPKASKPFGMEQELQTIAEEVLMVSPNISAKRLRQHFQTLFAGKPIPEEAQIAAWIAATKTRSY